MDLQSKLRNFFANRQKAAAPVVQQATDQVAKFGQNLIKPATEYFSATGNKGNNFWNSPVMRPVAQAQQFIERPDPIEIPRIPTILNRATRIQTPFGNIEPLEIGREVVNAPIRGVTGIFSDAAQNIGRTIGGRDVAQYSNLKSPVTRFGYNLSQIINPEGSVGLRIDNSPQQLIGNIAGAAETPFSLYGGGRLFGMGKEALKSAGKQTVMQTLKKQALTGARLGGISGLLTGLSEGRDETLLDQLFQGGNQALMTGTAGAVIGGGVSGVGHTVGAIRNRLINTLMQKHNISPEQADVIVKQFSRDELGKFVGKQQRTRLNKKTSLKTEVENEIRGKMGIPSTEPVFYGDLRESLGLPREGNYQEGKISFNALTGQKELPLMNGEKAVNKAASLDEFLAANQPMLDKLNPAQREAQIKTLTTIYNKKNPQLKKQKESVTDIDAFFKNLPESPKQKTKIYSNDPGLAARVKKQQVKEKLKGLLRPADEMNLPDGYTVGDSQRLSVPIMQKIKEKNIKPEKLTKEMLAELQSEVDFDRLQQGKTEDQVVDEMTKNFMKVRKQDGKLNAPEPQSDPDWIKAGDVAAKRLQTKNLRMPIKGNEAKLEKEFDDLVNKPTNQLDKKVGWHDKLRTPDRVLKKIGLGNEATNLRKSYDNYLKELPIEIDKITQWSKRADDKDSNAKIFKYLDGQQVELSDNDRQIALEVKDYLKNWAERLGLPEDRRVTNYITHIFDQETLKKEFDPEIARLIRDKVPGSVYDPFVEQRLGKLGYKEDVWQALDAYVKRGTRKANLDPVLKVIKEKSDSLEESQIDYVKNYIERINMRPTKLDNELDNSIKQSPIGYKFGQRPVTAITRGLRQMGYRGTLGLNVGSALRNLSQGANTYAKLGEVNTIKGYMNLFKNGTKELEEQGILTQNIASDDRTINATKKFWEKTDKRLFFFFELAEKINRGSAYYGAKAKALSEKKTEAEAIEYAKKIVRDTQFTFGSIDTPQILQGDINKTLLQFQSYNFKQAEFLAEMAKNKEYAGLARWAAANVAFAYTVGQAIGVKPEDAIPFWNIVQGEAKIGETPAIQSAGKLLTARFGEKDQYGNDLDTQDRIKLAVDAAVPMFPGGVQWKKTIEGLDAGRKGYSESASGRVQYPVPEDPVSIGRAAVFGKSKLPEAQKYFDEKRTPLGDKDSEVYKSLRPDKRQEFMDSVYKKRDTDKLLDQIKKRIESGENADDLIKQVGAAEELPTNNPLVQKAQEDIARKKAEVTGQTQMVGSKIFYADGGSVKSIDFNFDQRSGSGIDSFNVKNEKNKVARDVWAAPIKQSEKEAIFKKLGVDADDVRYDYMASGKFSAEERVGYIASKNMTHDQLMERLTTGRVVGISGEQFVSNGVLDLLVEQGQISKDEAKALKKLKLDKDGNSLVKAGTGGKGRKPSIKFDFRQYARSLTGVKPLQLKKSRTTTARTAAPRVKTLSVKELKFKDQPLKLKK